MLTESFTGLKRIGLYTDSLWKILSFYLIIVWRIYVTFFLDVFLKQC